MKQADDEPDINPSAEGLFDNIPKPILPPPPLEVPTGLSDESDAHRYLAQRFNTGFMCKRCDARWAEKLDKCPVCFWDLEIAEREEKLMQHMRALHNNRRKSGPWR